MFERILINNTTKNFLRAFYGVKVSFPSCVYYNFLFRNITLSNLLACHYDCLLIYSVMSLPDKLPQD
jgi:hypothetical protein